GAFSMGAVFTSKNGAMLDRSTVSGFAGSDGAKSDAGLSDGRVNSKLRTGKERFATGSREFATGSGVATRGGAAVGRGVGSRFFSQGSTSGSSASSKLTTDAAGTRESAFALGAPSNEAESIGAGTMEGAGAGGTGFEATGADGFTETLLETFATEGSVFCAAGAVCGPRPIPSPGKRIPQKPTAGSVNSN